MSIHKSSFEQITQWVFDRKKEALELGRYESLNGSYMPDYVNDFVSTLKRRLGEKTVKDNYEEFMRYAMTDYIFYHWCQYKKVYKLQNTFAKYLIETEDAPISLQTVERLPFNSFCITFERPDDLDGMFSNSFPDVDYLFVNVEIVEHQTMYLNIGIMQDEGNGKAATGIITTTLCDGDSFDSAYGKCDDADDMALYSFELGSAQKAKDESRSIARLVLNTIQYVCASNAEIRDVKSSKQSRPKVTVNGKERTVAVQTSEVGYATGRRFEQWYADTDEQGRKSGSKRKAVSIRPHVRRAHWHHYWTGKGRKILEVRWIEPVFCCGTDKEIVTVVHEVSGESKNRLCVSGTQTVKQ